MLSLLHHLQVFKLREKNLIERISAYANSFDVQLNAIDIEW